MAEVTTLLDCLNTDFKPKSPELQMTVYHSALRNLSIYEEEMQVIASVAVDKASQSVAASSIEGQAACMAESIFERIVLNNIVGRVL